MTRTLLITTFAALLTVRLAAAEVMFFAPDGWTPGATGSTYQEWDFFTSAATNAPDAGYLTDGTVLPTPNVAGPYVTASGSFYFWGGPYNVSASIYNYGAAAPTGYGTHVIVQTAATMNPDPAAGGPASVILDQVRIVDTDGNVLPGGSNAEALRIDQIRTVVVSGMGGTPATQEELIFEFFLPGYTGDFRVSTLVVVHSSFNQIRVDTQVATEAFPITVIPEPATALLLSFGLLALRRR
ncbi:MAG: hypothetical protein IPM18_07730 [Phycisphaerales bacterium]|nr:hypothetical protein [Phycisphaerales bacterium]